MIFLTYTHSPSRENLQADRKRDEPIRVLPRTILWADRVDHQVWESSLVPLRVSFVSMIRRDFRDWIASRFWFSKVLDRFGGCMSHLLRGGAISRACSRGPVLSCRRRRRVRLLFNIISKARVRLRFFGPLNPKWFVYFLFLCFRSITYVGQLSCVSCFWSARVTFLSCLVFGWVENAWRRNLSSFEFIGTRVGNSGRTEVCTSVCVQ